MSTSTKSKSPTKVKVKATVSKQNVGIDFAKDDFKVCFYQRLSTGKKRIKSSRSFNNTLAGFKSFHSWVEKHRNSAISVFISLEPTGVYHEQFLYYCSDKSNYQLCLVVGNQTKAYASSLGIKTKTDKVDARVLAQMGLERELRIWQPFSPNMLRNKQLSRERVRLVNDRTALQNRLHALDHAYNSNKLEIRHLKAQIKLLNKQIQEVEAALHALVDADPKLKERLEKVCSIPGIGFITATVVVAEMDAFELFTSRAQVVSYCGYDIVQRESGSSVKGKTRISKKGNRWVRRALYMPSLSAIRWAPMLQKLYERVTERSGIKMKGVVAVQRKLLLLIYTLFTKNEKYDPNYGEEKTEEEEGKTT